MDIDVLGLFYKRTTLVKSTRILTKRSGKVVDKNKKKGLIITVQRDKAWAFNERCDLPIVGRQNPAGLEL